MSLTLTVLSFNNKPIYDINSVVINDTVGGIGRKDDNTLILPDKFVSRHHATIKTENGYYYLTCTSSNGVVINDELPLLINDTQRLDNGSRLKIGEYEIAVAITQESLINDVNDVFFEPLLPTDPTANISIDEPWAGLEEVGINSLMMDNFPKHEDLVQPQIREHQDNFISALPVNQTPFSDSYIAPDIISPPSSSSFDEIPENIDFDDFFSTAGVTSTDQIVNNPTAHDDFEDFFKTALDEIGAEIGSLTPITTTPLENNQETNDLGDLATRNDILFESPAFFSPAESVITNVTPDVLTENKAEVYENMTIFDRDTPPLKVSPPELLPPTLDEQITPIVKISHTKDDKIEGAAYLPTEQSLEKKAQTIADSRLFNAFLQGVAIECKAINHEQQSEVLHRIGQMFRKLIDGTVAVLRTRAEFKREWRVQATVIRASNNNPLKFTVLTDDVLRQLIENKTDGFLSSTVAIEESFNDIMNHQLAMQAGIQASLTDLLKTFDPKVIEIQFSQGLVLQKKAKCWDSYEKIYRNTVEDAVENFFGDEFVNAYEKQMSLLINARKKQQGI